jgi:DNA ligase 1
MSIFKPMLACEADLAKLRFPLLASPKLDGVRAIVRDGIVYSRSNKPIPNKWVQERFRRLEHHDGELIFGEPTADDCYRRTVSAVMSHDNTDGADVRFYVFDHVGHPHLQYEERAEKIDTSGRGAPSGAVLLFQSLVHNLEELLEHERDAVDAGYEGLILRDPNAPYKMGRSTAKEGYLLKVKRFVDAEAVVIGFEERMHNGNEATVSELGRTKRSSHAAGKSGRGDLGALVARSSEGVEFNIGTGFSDAERAAVWENRDHYLGQLAKYKFFPVGVKEAPRHPVFLGWRDRSDT